MQLLKVFAPLRAAARTLLIPTAMLAAAISHGGIAEAKDTQKADIFVGVFKDDVKPIVVFVFSDSTTGKLKEIDAAAFYVKPDYKPESEEAFDPTKGCVTTLDFSLKQVPKGVALTISNTPIYGPNSKQAIIDPFSLPSFMGREAVKALSAQRLVASDDAASSYFNCAGWIWARMLDQPPEFWNEFLKKKIADKKKELKQ